MNRSPMTCAFAVMLISNRGHVACHQFGTVCFTTAVRKPYTVDWPLMTRTRFVAPRETPDTSGHSSSCTSLSVYVCVTSNAATLTPYSPAGGCPAPATRSVAAILPATTADGG